MLSDTQIRAAIEKGRIGVTPYQDRLVQPASLDVTLAPSFMKFSDAFTDPIDPLDPPGEEEYDRFEADVMVLWPRQFVLGSTAETVTISNDIVCRIEGKSSLARLGLIVHATAGFVDPGWSGRLTLEISNLSPRPILLHAGMPVAQLSFQNMSAPARTPYGADGLGSKYRGQHEPTPSRRRLPTGVEPFYR